ncbi:hypothetical protein NBRC10512_004919 [Rhodotorula toruloides]|uniref:RHTO0S01e12750g1_1 n=2 Tax=Rhodotorula toruloides TaxID=5286 RepID=A0A061AL45_RHOTO|nr:uncharacterized protein RHTO_04692 [Rhodotorula toruloides NP11]EMS24513.1 hypothetical protein RHTO_04692 [Rhodotorula toruloides NP11]CDR36035.1 RHTO0S01e12750g1_1 [Rhodotorula toruloides]
MASPISSPLGPLHLAHPADQAQPIRTLLSLFRRSRTTSNSANPKAKSVSTPRRLEKAANLLCHIDDTCGNTFIAQTAEPSSPPPPYYVAAGQEEDLVCLEVGEVVEAARKQDELARQRQELLEQDRRMGEELARLGF